MSKIEELFWPRFGGGSQLCRRALWLHRESRWHECSFALFLQHVQVTYLTVQDVMQYEHAFAAMVQVAVVPVAVNS